MKFVVSQESLHNELQFLQGIAEKKKTIPILSNILLRAEGDFLTLTATDLEVSLTGGCGAQVEETGGIAFSHVTLTIRPIPILFPTNSARESSLIPQSGCWKNEYKVIAFQMLSGSGFGPKSN